MTRRVRFLGALLALLSFSAWQAESVLASLCPPGMDEAMAMEGRMASDAGGGAMTMENAIDAGHSQPEAPDAPGDAPPGPDLGHCPFAAPGAGSTCVTAHMPAGRQALPVPRLDAAADLPASDFTTDLLLASGLFHPPRA